jgi:hypothetical protein
VSAAPSFEAAPAYGAPMRFFLTAPAFALAAALLLAWSGPEALASRWTPAALALTHLVTLGFLAMVMVGALFQFVAVFTGRRLPANDFLAALVHAGLALGTPALAAGLLLGLANWIRGGALALGVALAAFVAACAWRLARAPSRDASLAAIGCALAGLAVTVALGVTLGVALAGGLDLPLAGLADAHAAWGAVGWLLGLVAAVALRVVPMFQVTPPYPRPIERGFAPAMLAALAAWSLLGPGWARAALELLIALGAALFAAVTLVLLAKRRRRATDATVAFLQLGMASLAAAALLWTGARLVPALAGSEATPVALGALVFVGFGMSVATGMLYRIVPFLTWLRQSRSRAGAAAAPRVRSGVPHALLHAAGTALLVLAAPWPEALARPAGIVLGCSAAVLAWQLARFPIFLMHIKPVARR